MDAADAADAGGAARLGRRAARVRIAQTPGPVRLRARALVADVVATGAAGLARWLATDAAGFTGRLVALTDPAGEDWTARTLDCPGQPRHSSPTMQLPRSAGRPADPTMRPATRRSPRGRHRPISAPTCTYPSPVAHGRLSLIVPASATRH